MKQNKSGKLYCAYHIECDECGHRCCSFVIYPPNAKEWLKRTWDKQFRAITEPSHRGHNWRYVSTLIGGTLKDFNKYKKLVEYEYKNRR